jgi:hypothetical protein
MAEALLLGIGRLSQQDDETRNEQTKDKPHGANPRNLASAALLPTGPTAEPEKWSNKRWLNSGGSAGVVGSCERLRPFSGKYRAARRRARHLRGAGARGGVARYWRFSRIGAQACPLGGKGVLGPGAATPLRGALANQSRSNDTAAQPAASPQSST